MSKAIFIHIPKTGGTTINTALEGSQWQTEPDFHYRHIILKTKVSNAADIFQAKNIEKYQAFKIFMMLRHPVDRAISEYYFLKERKNFMDLLQRPAKNFKSYINNKQTHNGVLKFLKGYRMFDPRMIGQKDLEEVIECIGQIPIKVGIFEHFDASLQYFEQEVGLTFKKEIPVKRITFKRPKKEDLSQELQELILKNNALDYALYQKYEALFIEKAPQQSKFSFNKDKYAHVIPYAMGICLFEYCMENKKFIKSHFEFFKGMTFHYLKEKRITNGKLFVQLWNRSFVDAFSLKFTDLPLATKLQEIQSQELDPLKKLEQIAATIDKTIQEDSFAAQQYFQPIPFQATLLAPVPEVKKEAAPKKGFWKKLFGK
jgi:hypothetical protein